MTNSPRPTSLALGLLTLVTSPLFATGSECVIATVDGVVVRVADADALRAFVQPPPSRDAARRLAVDAALAHLSLRGWLAPSSTRGRLEAWTLWLAALERESGEDTSGTSAELQLERAARRFGVVAGPCAGASYESSPAPSSEETGFRADGAADSALLRANRGAPVIHAVELFVPGGGEPLPELPQAPDDFDALARRLRAAGHPARVVDLGRIAPHQVVGAFADVAFALQPGEVSPLFETAFGLHVVRVVERWEPGELGRRPPAGKARLPE